MSSTDKTSPGDTPVSTLGTYDASKKAWRRLLKGKTEEEGKPILERIITAYEAFDEGDEDLVPIRCKFIDSAGKWRFKASSIEALADLGHPSEVFESSSLAVNEQLKGNQRQSVFAGKLCTWSDTRPPSPVSLTETSQQYRW